MKILLLQMVYFLMGLNSLAVGQDKSSQEPPDYDLHISSDEMDFDSGTNIANAVGNAHAFRYVKKDDGSVSKQTIDAKRFKAHFTPQEKSQNKKKVGTGDDSNIDIIEAFEDVVIETKTQIIWADECTYRVREEHIHCEGHVHIKDKKTNNEAFGDKAKVNLKTERYTIKRGKKPAQAKIVSKKQKTPKVGTGNKKSVKAAQ